MSFKTNIHKIYLFKFLISLNFFGAVLVPFFTDWGGLSFSKMMLLQSWFAVWIFLLEIPTGTVADYLGRKDSLLFACLANIAGTIVAASGPSFAIFLLAEFMWAMSTALLTGADSAFVYDSLKETGETAKSKKIFANIESIAKIGMIIGPPVGSLIVIGYGIKAPMLAMAIPYLIAFFVGLKFKEPSTEKKIESFRYINILKSGIKYFYKNKILKLLAFDMIAIDTVAYMMIWLYQPILKMIGINIGYYGFVHAGLMIFQVAMMMNYEKMENLLKTKKCLLFLSAVITGLMFVITGLTVYVPVVILAIVVGGGVGSARKPLFISYMNKFIESSERATVLSTVSMIRRLVQAIVIPIVGILVDWSLSYTLIILGILALIFTLLSKTREEYLID